jgi:hypothetical protein
MTKNKKRNRALRGQGNSQGDLNQWLGLPPTARDESQGVQADLSGSSTASQIQGIEARMRNQENQFEQKLGALQNEMMKRFDQLALSLSTNQLPVQTGQSGPEPVAQSRYEPESIAHLLYEGSKQQAFMQAHSQLKPLYGNEGRSKVEAYFRTFESMTRAWSSQRQADLIAPH